MKSKIHTLINMMNPKVVASTSQSVGHDAEKYVETTYQDDVQVHGEEGDNVEKMEYEFFFDGDS